MIPKARASLERYGHQVVIGNDLHTRKYQVVFVVRPNVPASAINGDLSKINSDTWLRVNDDDIANGKELEEDIVIELVKRHDIWINKTT